MKLKILNGLFLFFNAVSKIVIVKGIDAEP